MYIYNILFIFINFMDKFKIVVVAKYTIYLNANNQNLFKF